jgi:hypothetical protein
VDIVKAAHVNDLQLGLIAVETELGTDPAGAYPSVKIRLKSGIDTDELTNKDTTYTMATFDVGLIDPSNASAFRFSQTVGFFGKAVVGLAQIITGATGYVQHQGIVTINLGGRGVVGSYLKFSSTLGKARATSLTQDSGVWGLLLSHVATAGGAGRSILLSGTQKSGGSTDTSNISDNISLNAFRIAVNGSLAVFAMIDGIVDEFESEAGVDTGGSANEKYDASGDFYENVGVDVTSGETFSASSTGSTGAVSQAFDNSTAHGWGTSSSATGWVKVDFGVSDERTIVQYTMIGYTAAVNSAAKSPRDFTLQGSNNDSDWTTLNTQTGVTWSDGQKREYSFSNSTAYRYYKVDITANNGDSEVVIVELELIPGVNMVIVSNNFTAEAEPTIARLVIFNEDVDAVTINTDLKVYASRDGGSTYTQIILGDLGDYESGKRILAGQIDIAGQPSGTSMKWKYETLNEKKQKYHGVSLSWS